MGVGAWAAWAAWGGQPRAGKGWHGGRAGFGPNEPSTHGTSDGETCSGPWALDGRQGHDVKQPIGPGAAAALIRCSP